MLRLGGQLVLSITTFPRDERRFSVHVWPSASLQPEAVTRTAPTASELAHRRHPCLHHTAREVHVIHLSHASSAGKLAPQGVLDVTLSLDGVAWRLGVADAKTMLAASLNIDVYNHVSNAHDEDTLNLCGSAIMPLVALAWQGNATAAVRSPLYVPGERANNLTRGELVCPPMEGGAARVMLDGAAWVVQMERSVFERMVTSIMQPDAAALTAPVRRWVEAFGRLKPRYRCMRGINAYSWDARLCRVPMYGYVCRPAPPDRADVYEHLLRVVFRRVGCTEQQFMATPLESHTPYGKYSPHGCVPTIEKFCQHASEPRRATLPERVLTEVLGTAVHWMPYLLDQVGDGADARTGKMNRRNIESFDFARMLLKLDCEDGGKEVVIEFMALVALRATRSGGSGAVVSPALARLVEVACMYIPFMWLVAVSSIEINEDHMERLDDLPAHMHAALVPASMWRAWTADVREQPPLPAWCDDDAVRRSARAPGVLIIEGTGFLDGTGDDPTLEQRTLLYNVVASQAGAAWNNARKEFGFNRGAPSGFYKILVVSYSPAWAEHGLCGFVPMQAGDTGNYGLRFQDVNAPQADRARWASIRFRPLPALTVDERRVVERVALEHYPLAALPLPSGSATFVYRRAEPVADTLRAQLATLVANDATLRDAAATHHCTAVPVRWYLNYANMTPDAADAIVRALRFAATGTPVAYSKAGQGERTFVAWTRSARVDREDIMDGLGGYHIELVLLLAEQ